jgi:hypothetical protein
MPKRLAARFLSLALILAVFALGTQAVSHSHGIAHEEDHCTCQMCHVGHVAIPQPASQVQIQESLPVERFVPGEESAVTAEVLVTPSNPRAPPA